VNTVIDQRFEINWKPRLEPLSPCAVGARGNSAFALAKRLLDLSDDELARLTGIAASELLVVLGPAESLPWVDGVVYFGRSEASSSLLLPTAYAPDVPLALFESALLARHKSLGRAAIFLNPRVVVPLGKALPIKRTALESWVESRKAGG